MIMQAQRNGRPGTSVQHCDLAALLPNKTLDDIPVSESLPLWDIMSKVIIQNAVHEYKI